MYLGPQAKGIGGARVVVFTTAESKAIFDTLHAILLQDPVPKTVKVFGKEYPERRLVEFFSKDNHAYKYSGSERVSKGWPDVMVQLASRAEELTGETGFDSALVNLYRDSNDAMGLHRDDDAMNSCIVSFSFGATRIFQIK